MTRYIAEARALDGPPRAIAIRDALVADLERAERALAMVDHGATILARIRRRGRELEAQTALKRGYLNLMHAREAVARHAAEAEDLEALPDAAPVPAANVPPTRPTNRPTKTPAGTSTGSPTAHEPHA